MITLDAQLRERLRRMQRQEKDKRRYVKITVLLMLDLGFSAIDTAVALGIDDSTVYRYADHYIDSGSLGDYLQDKYVPYDGKLSAEQLRILCLELSARLYRTAKEIASFIANQFGVTYSATGVVPLLKRLGFVYKKTRQVPVKTDPVAQKAFLEQLDGLLSSSQASTAAVYFLDAVHPQHNTRSCHGWIKSGEDFEVLSNSGRERVNINGALNAHDVTDVVVREDERINADSVIALYQQLQQKHPRGEITVICDNARYYRSRIVKEWIQTSRIRQVFLPSYSPNLNLIERLWKYLRKKVIDAEYYQTKQKFREAIFGFFENIRQYKAELESLLTLNFHIA
jgi:transposase